uniref:R-spondin 4 n=1 Tax=Ficedula albicollis TaxID=59894 RepID=A0A803VAU0_FICAL
MICFLPCPPSPALAGAEPASRLDDLISSLSDITPSQMQWIIFMLLLFISSMEMLTQNRWKKQASAGLLENCTGCVLCSEDNGCITCHHRLFLLIWRDGIRQYGMCVHTCPPGYFGVRGLEVNRCTSTSRASRGPPAPTSAPCSPRRLSGPSAAGRAMASFPTASRLALDPGTAGRGGFVRFSLAQSCSRDPAGFGSPVGAGGGSADRPSLPAECRSPSCESCFSRDFCMKCKDKFYLYKGQCFRQCPPGTAAQPGTRECQETCEPGPWSEWSACTHESRTCGCKWGVETRVREVPEAAREEGTACPALLETRRCRMKKHCPGEKTEPKNKGKKRQKKPKTERHTGT